MSFEDPYRRIGITKETNSTSIDLFGLLKEFSNRSGYLEKFLTELKTIRILTAIDLGDNQITDINSIVNLKEIKRLYLAHNQITDLTPLRNLTELIELDLRNNQVTDISPLKDLSKLTKLNLSNNQITDFTPLKDLSKLTKLNLSNNQITDFTPLNELSELTTLDLSDNQIIDITPLKDLSKLTKLNLSNNQITDFTPLNELSELTTLDLSNNQITDIDMLNGHPQLNSLNLSKNQITDISPLKNLLGLIELDLSNNQIANIGALKNLSKLNSLFLSNNRLISIRAIKSLSKLTTLFLRNNVKIEKILPKEVINDIHNPERIINYYLKVKDGRPINEAKIVVIGEADYGKTLLIHRLVNDTYIKTERTHGIIITEWNNVEVNNQKVRLNIWDFGGQKIMQNTHQYFFTERTLYILVLNARQNEASNKTREHLERIKSIAGDSPIIVVGNKIDTNKGEFDINRSELREEFNIKGFFPVCSNKKEDKEGLYDKNFDDFKSAVISEIGKLDGIHKPFREEWFEIKDYLEVLKQKKQQFIKYHDYLTFCIEHQVKEAIDQTEIVTFLNELGLVVYLQKKKNSLVIEIGDKLIFNPEWLISGVYAVIDNPQKLKRRAVLDFETFKTILNECNFEKYTYHPEDYKYILNMMIACKLCVKMKDSKDDYLIPDHLSEDKSKVLKEYEETLRNLKFQINFQFKYIELFDDIFRRFLIAMYDDVYKDYYWKTGVVLDYEECKALITANNSDNKIIIQIEGESSRKRQNLLALIHRAFRDIHNSYPNLSFAEWIAHKDHPQILKNYGELTSMEEDIKEYEERTVYCQELKGKEHIDNFLDNVRRIEKDKKEEQENMANVRPSIYVQGDAQFNFDDSKGQQNLNKIDSRKFEEKLDEILGKLNQKQNEEIQNLTNSIFDKLNEKFLRANNFPEKEIEDFNKAKLSSDTRAKLKWTYPFSQTIKELTGFEFEIEKEIAVSKEITSDAVINFLRKLLWFTHEKLQTIELDKTNDDDDLPKFLRS